MKFFYLLSRDIITFFRDYRNSILLVFMPVFIVLLLGMAFLNTQPSEVPVMVCDMEKGNISEQIISFLEEKETFKIINIDENCKENINKGIRSSTVRAGIIIPPNVTEDLNQGRVAEIEVIYDNTKPIKNFVVFYMRLVSNEFSNKLTRELINNSWVHLENTSSQLATLKGDLEAYSSDLENIIENSKEVSKRMDELENNFSSSLSELPEISVDLRNSLKNQNISGDIASLKINVHKSSQSVDNLIIITQAMAADPSTAAYATPLLNNLTQIKQTLTDAEKDLDDVDLKLKTTNQNLDVSLEKLEKIQATNISIELRNIITEMESNIEVLDQTHGSVNSLSEKISFSKDIFDNLTDKDPRFVAEPVTFNSEEAFGELRFIDFLFPSIMIVILMMISILIPATTLVRDRSSGLLQRILISPIGLKFLITEKAVSNFSISAIQVPFILLIGVVFFGININVANIIPIALVSVITIFTFVFLGLVIACFSKTESTALLASMLFIIPMIFLSGIFIPVEVMPLFLRDVTGILPLSLSSKLLQGAMLGTSTADLLSLTANLVLYIIQYAIIAWFVLRRTLTI